MNKQMIKQSSLTLTLLLSTLLVGCGGSDSDDAEVKPVTQAKYSLSNSRCLDSNLNGVCDSGEVAITSENAEQQTSASPIISNYQDFTLTAQSNSSLVTPFTTLINNEVIFNPIVNGSVDKAKQYLTEKLGIDFSQLDKVDGPKEAADKIIESLKAAHKLDAPNAYVAIAAAVELMIFENALTVSPKQENVDKLSSSISIKDVFVINNNDQIGVKTFDIHPTTGRIIMVASNEELISLNANNGDYAAVQTDSGTSTTTTPAAPTTTDDRRSLALLARDGDEGEEDDDEDEEDDDDDEYEDWTNTITNQNVISIKQVVQHQNDENFYLLTSQDTITNGSLCQTSGDYGAFLSNVNGTQAQDDTTGSTGTTGNRGSNDVSVIDVVNRNSSPALVDAYSGATGTTTTPTTPTTLPPVTSSEAACYNNGLIAMAATPDSSVVLVASNESSGHKLYRLSGDELIPTQDFAYTLENFGEVNSLSISDNGKLAALTDVARGQLTIVNLDTMETQHVFHPGDAKLSDAKFISNDKVAAAQFGSDQLYLFTVSDTAIELSSQMRVKHPINHLAVNTTQVIAVADSNQVSVLSARDGLSEKNHFTDLGPQINQLGILSDKVVYTNGQTASSFLAVPNQLNYITFGGEMGSPLRLAQKLLTTGLVLRDRIGSTTWRSGDLVLPTNMTDFGLEGVTVKWTTNAPDNIDVNTGRVTGILPADARVNAAITGQFRFETITINKVFSIF